MRRLIYLLPVLAFIGLAAYFALALRPSYDPRALPSTLINKPAPAFALQAMQQGDELSRDGLKGHVAVVNFFASWCVPCRLEHPVLLRLAQKEKIPLYGIDYKDKPDDAAKYLAQLGDPYRRIGVDASGRAGLDFGVYGVPETYVIDRAGVIRYKFTGPLTAEDVDHVLLPLLRQLEAAS